ncbi:MAG: hypothetical protein HQK65_12855 [Desulfamplus sp.]|nr:hypothetical protein [Desulfamplus sp.]
MGSVIATKLNMNMNNPQLGYVQPIILEMPDGSSRISEIDDFPNANRIFITSGYEEYIENTFIEGEYFRILYSENDRIKVTADLENINNCQYVSKASDITKMQKSDYPHIISGNVSPERLNIQINFFPKRYIFVHDEQNNKLVGPFDFENVNNDNTNEIYSVQLKPLESIFGFQTSTQWVALEFPFKKSIIGSFKGQKFLTISLSNLIKITEPKQIDFITDDLLIKWANRLPSKRNSSLSRKELAEFREALSQSHLVDNEFNSERLKRTTKLLDKTEYFISQKSSLIAEHLSSIDGQLSIDQYFENNLEIVLEKSKNRIDRELNKKYGNFEEKRIKLEGELNELRDQKNKIKSEIQQSQKELTKKIEGELTERICKLNQEITDSNEQLQQTLSNLNLAKKIDTLKNEAYRLEHNNEEKRKEQKQLQDTQKALNVTISELRREVGATNEELCRKLREIKPYVDLLNGNIPESKPPINRSIGIVNLYKNQPNNLDEFSALVVERLSKLNRNIDQVDAANYLTSIHQNFLVVFAGLPGSGKTSLVTYLAKVLGFTQTQSTSFLHVATARGWTSQRDILGFYNSLAGEFQSSSTGLYHALKACSEARVNHVSEITPQWILLDEANLSPMEHYWSSFMLMCDPHTPRIIDTGDPNQTEKILIPDHLRFLATVNFDHTTEQLSPRIIDRAPIIQMDLNPPNIFEINEINDNDDQVEFEAISLETWNKIFAQTQPGLTEDESQFFKSIINTLHRYDSRDYIPPIIISPRKQKMLSFFCASVRTIMMRRYDLCAFDLAIVQHILPLINGSGDSYRKRLIELQKVISPLDISKRMLDKIISIGDSEHGFYQFFC